MQLKIRGRLLLLFFVLAAAPMATIGVLSYYNSVHSMQQVVEERTLATATEAKTEIMRRVAPRRSEVKLLARNREIQDLYAFYDMRGEQAVLDMQDRIHAFFIQFFTGPRQLFAQIHYLDATGDLVFKYARATDDQLSLNNYAFATSDSTFLPVDLSSWGDDTTLRTDYLSGYGPVLRLGRWIERDGKRVGFVLADLQIDRLLQQAQVDQYFRDEDFVLIERDHDRLLAFPQPFLVGQQVERALPDLGPIYAAIRQQGEQTRPRCRPRAGCMPHHNPSYTRIVAARAGRAARVERGLHPHPQPHTHTYAQPHAPSSISNTL